MRVGLQVASASLIALVLTASAHATPQPVISPPDWLRKPTGEEVEGFYPERARREQVSGQVSIACHVTIEGLLTMCQTSGEKPTGFDFGRAAVELSSLFRLNPKLVDGQAVDGGTITIPIVFHPPRKPAVGDEAIVLTKFDPDSPPAKTEAPVVTCPNGEGECQGHYLDWLARPDRKTAAQILASVTPSERGTGAVCTVAPDGLLKDCEFGGDDLPDNVAVAQKAVALMRASSTTEDGVPTAGLTVLIPFKWEWWAGGYDRP